ncbi:MAG: M6 family metalloprotease domain-containing protein [Bacteroidales bacterium]
MKNLFVLRRLFVSILFFLTFHSFAAWLNSIPQTIVQPDGSVIECFATGDEFYNWLHDKDGFTIIQDIETGYYSYAVLDGDQLVPSSYLAGKSDPSGVGLTPWTNISGEKMKAKRLAFVKNEMPEKEHLQGYTNPKSVKNEGTLNNLVVYIRFSDQSEFTQDTMTYYNMFNNNNSGYNSMVNYFYEVSYEQLTLPSTFYPIPPNSTVISYQDIYARSYFMPYSASNTNGYQESQKAAREHALLKRAINYIDDEVPEGLDLDFDNNGYVDNVVFIIKGAPTAWSTLLWPHRWVLYNEVVYIHGKRVYDYNFQLETSLGSSGTGVLCHEMFHTLSAPDLYHYNSAPYSAVGPWDIMEQDNNPPESMGAYMKFRYGGWIDNIPEITECGTYTINSLSEPDNNCFKIASPNSNTDFYVVEYRVKAGTFENSLPNSGLLVYRINSLEDGNGNAQGPPDEVYLYRPGGSNSTNGDLNSATFAADYSRTEINDGTDPDPFLTNGQPGGLDISNVGFIGETISFDVNFEKEPVADFEASENLLSVGCSVNFTDLSVCNTNTWNWAFEGGTPSSSTEQNPQGIVYENAGIFSVTLTVSNAFGNDTEAKSSFIEVNSTSAPEVIFYASDTAVCTGSNIMLMDFSKICPETWNWEISPSSYEFVNGTSASTQNPEVQFNESTSYSISLTATNSNGSNTLSKVDYIFAGGTPFPFYEDFESGNIDQSGWTIVNPDNDNITWGMHSASGNGGNYSAGINLYNYFQVFKRDQLISPPFNLSFTTNAVLKFDHAYALYQNLNYSDSLIVKISADCGNTWTRILELKDDGSGNFATHEPLLFNFVPATADDWCGSGFGGDCYEVDISAWTGTPDVQIMFESFRVSGNNMYIDNVSVNVQTGEQEMAFKNYRSVEIYPNPSPGVFTVSCFTSSKNVNIIVYNAQGRLILNEMYDNSNPSKIIDLTNQPKGLYLIHFLSDNVREVNKIILE